MNLNSDRILLDWKTCTLLEGRQLSRGSRAGRSTGAPVLPGLDPAERELRRQQCRKAFEARLEDEKRKTAQMREYQKLNNQGLSYFTGTAIYFIFCSLFYWYCNISHFLLFSFSAFCPRQLLIEFLRHTIR